jgi:hypothetical protein
MMTEKSAYLSDCGQLVAIFVGLLSVLYGVLLMIVLIENGKQPRLPDSWTVVVVERVM